MSNSLGEDGAAISSGVQSVDRAITVLEILAQRGTAGVTEVATDIGVHKSTASRLLSALEDRGLVQQSGGRGKYQLGFGVLRLASSIPGGLDIVSQAGATLEDLADLAGETVNLAVLRSHYAVNLTQVRGPAAVSAQNWTGQLTPLHATSSGKILLAHQTPDRQRRLLDEAGLTRYTAHTIASPDVLADELAQALVDGYATTVEEYEIGLNAIAAPVLDSSGRIAGAISVSGPAYRLDRARMDALRDDLIAGARSTSARMGHLAR